MTSWCKQRKDYKSAPISDQDRVMLDFVVQLTKDATKISRDDHVKRRCGIRRHGNFADCPDCFMV